MRIGQATVTGAAGAAHLQQAAARLDQQVRTSAGGRWHGRAAPLPKLSLTSITYSMREPTTLRHVLHPQRSALCHVAAACCRLPAAVHGANEGYSASALAWRVNDVNELCYDRHQEPIGGCWTSVLHAVQLPPSVVPHAGPSASAGMPLSTSDPQPPHVAS